MRNQDDEEIFQLPDGSLFFLSSRQHDTALYNCASVGVDGEIFMSQPAALIVYGEIHAAVMDVEETTILADNQEDKVEYEEVQTKVAKTETTTNTIHIEVIEEEIPATVYIIFMIIVSAMTVLIIAGAAIIFTKIKHMPSEHDPEGSDKEMISSTKLDCTDSGWRNMDKLPSYDLYGGSMHQYQKPINMLSTGYHAPNTGPYASCKIAESKRTQTSYQKLQPIYMQPKDSSY